MPFSVSPEFQTTDSQDRKSLSRRVLATIFALIITATILLGYAYLRWRYAERLRADEAARTPIQKPILPPQVQVFIDEAMIKGPQAVIGGTVQNISTNRLMSVNVEIELKRRKDGGSEVRSLDIVPGDLDPQQQGRYTLNVPSREYRESRVLAIKSGDSATIVPFSIKPGATRPDERLPENKTIVVKPAPKPGKGEEFINTPENPVKVP